MWLLETHDFTLHFFISPEKVLEGYVILSHTWLKDEQSFQDLERIRERCAVSGEDPRTFVSSKIRRCCEVAEAHGYKWAWIDTCCIDKTSSAELSEAINSMFRYYSLALVCYVYLREVRTVSPARMIETVCNPRNVQNTLFARDRWHTRGWTLQELIAPRVVHFLSKDWHFLGSRADLAEGLQVITRIPATVLRLQQKPKDISVAQRMSWAAGRQTTRPEDEAYCLLGIFDINMPTLYGEGRKAFQRLQEEIMRQSPDTTLFAWGDVCNPYDLDRYRDEEGIAGVFALKPSDFRLCSGMDCFARTIGKEEDDANANNVNNANFANDTNYANDANDASANDTRDTTNRNDATNADEEDDFERIMTFSITPHGILIHALAVEINGYMFVDLTCYQGEDRLLLLLKQRPRTTFSTVDVYDIGISPSDENGLPRRLIRIPAMTRAGHNSNVQDFPALDSMQLEWQDLYLANRVASLHPIPPLYIPLNHIFKPCFRVPEELLINLPKEHVSDLQVDNARLPWTGEYPMVISYTYRHPKMACALKISIQIGICDEFYKPWQLKYTSRHRLVWANIRFYLGTRFLAADYTHSPRDHVVNWPKRLGLQRVQILTGIPVLPPRGQGPHPPPGYNALDPDPAYLAACPKGEWTFVLVFELTKSKAAQCLTLTEHWMGEGDLTHKWGLHMRHRYIAALGRALDALGGYLYDALTPPLDGDMRHVYPWEWDLAARHAGDFDRDEHPPLSDVYAHSSPVIFKPPMLPWRDSGHVLV
ncbi:heterokaryon incompatibility protein-domain-containing protein [Daedaleopsis nitida]|nr:heterokaryon incompatibility protein-domain-containing protein [Daedaleopsis nitida]